MGLHGPIFFFVLYINTSIAKGSFNMSKYNDMIPKVLDKLHINKDRKGYLYLKETIELMHDEKITTIHDAYDIIASRHHVSASTIESSIRRCIKDGIIHCPSRDKIDIFGYDIAANHRNSRNYYTNVEFIIYIMNYIHKKIKKI